MTLFTNEDGIFQKCFGFLGKLIAINFLWMLCSLPVFTIGASTTAMYYTMLKLHKYGDCSVRDFFRSFRQNFKQATGIWLMLLMLIGSLLYGKRAMDGVIGLHSQMFSYGAAVVTIWLFLMVLYLFPTLAAFENKMQILMANAFFFAVKHTLFTICIALITVFPMFFTLVDAKLFPVYLFVWLLCGFALTAYANAWFFYKIFKPHLGETNLEEVL